MSIAAAIQDTAVPRWRRLHSGYGLLAMRAIEVGAAAVIVAFGGLLLAGYMVTERLVAI
jgi:nickel/cobalt transporter (NicO) family protein